MNFDEYVSLNHIILGAVQKLHRDGFESVRAQCGLSASGMFWRTTIVHGA